MSAEKWSCVASVNARNFLNLISDVIHAYIIHCTEAHHK